MRGVGSRREGLRRKKRVGGGRGEKNWEGGREG